VGERVSRTGEAEKGNLVWCNKENLLGPGERAERDTGALGLPDSPRGNLRQKLKEGAADPAWDKPKKEMSSGKGKPYKNCYKSRCPHRIHSDPYRKNRIS